MMRRFLLILTLFLLTGCTAEKTVEPSPAPPPPEPPEITEESIRAKYEAEGLEVREIRIFKGDFVVYAGSQPENGQFFWVYGDTGEACPLYFSTNTVLSWRTEDTGRIKVIHGGASAHHAAMYFPSVAWAYTAHRLDQDGNPIPEGYAQEDTYWAPLTESHIFGWPHGPNALVDLRVTAGGIETVFGPTAGETISFFAAASSIPVVEPVYDEASRTMTLKFRDTALTSGEPVVVEDPDEQRQHDALAAMCRFPTVFPAGKVTGSNEYISAVEVRETAEGVEAVLTLTESAVAYTAWDGQLLNNESRPYLRLTFRDVN